MGLSGEVVDRRWVTIVMRCVTTVAYRIKVNGELSDQADERSAGCLQNVLSLHEICSGQTINKEKSSIMFNSNSRESRRASFKATLDIGVEAWNEKYFGLVVYMGRSKAKTFNYLKERVWKIQGWKEKLLSRAWKDILIKAVSQAIPTFAMSCFDLTKTLCDKISMLICHVFWAQQDRENKMHWISWEHLCSQKDKGGLGYRDLHLFNLGMLARQAWQLLSNPESLCAWVLRAKYFHEGKLLEVGPGISYSWRSIVRGVQALKSGLIWRVGYGTKIDI
ncbi:hypothetical protein OsJ_06364 [Oryza sativa Japonica Group]|uniref:Uncharacterized protein n=1 Tax=Oryza sativa subsp. japonica TaxID=39947 RepID=B9F554_ORYSJ|nr:hypothetical protein OsJ_06364 [Oryza sativa Japonica Group]